MQSRVQCVNILVKDRERVCDFLSYIQILPNDSGTNIRICLREESESDGGTLL